MIFRCNSLRPKNLTNIYAPRLSFSHVWEKLGFLLGPWQNFDRFTHRNFPDQFKNQFLPAHEFVFTGQVVAASTKLVHLSHPIQIINFATSCREKPKKKVAKNVVFMMAQVKRGGVAGEV